MKKLLKFLVVMVMGAIVAFGGLYAAFADSPNGLLPPLDGWGMVIGSVFFIIAELALSEGNKQMSRTGLMFHTGAYITTATFLWLWGTVGTYTSYYTVNNFGYYDEFSSKTNGLIPFIILAVVFVMRIIIQIVMEREKKCA